MEQLTLLSEEVLVKTFQLQGIEPDFMESVLHWQGNISDFLMKYAHNGLYGKMSRAVFQQTGETISQHSSMKWKKSGMVWHGEFWTHSISECPKDAVASSLSGILETGDHLSPYYLSPRACQGILRRAEKKNVVLPDQFLTVLKKQIKMEA